MRIIKVINNCCECVILYVCSAINDVSLICIDIITKCNVLQGEDMYLRLKDNFKEAEVSKTN